MLRLIFSQTDPPLGADAVSRIRTKAKKMRAYSLPVVLDPPAQGRSSDGKPLPVDTLGRWLFGLRGFRGHTTVIPAATTLEISINCDAEPARRLLVTAAERLGLRLLWISSSEGKIIEVGRIIMKELEDIWGKLRLMLMECGDIGEFDADEFDIDESAKHAWKGKPPIGLDDLNRMRSAKTPTMGYYAASPVYNSLGIVAGWRLGLKGDGLRARVGIAFGDWLASIICGISGGHGTDLDGELLDNAYAAAQNNQVRIGHVSEEAGEKFFDHPEVQRAVKAAFDVATFWTEDPEEYNRQIRRIWDG